MERKLSGVDCVSHVSHRIAISGFVTFSSTHSSSNFGSTDLALISRIEGQVWPEAEGKKSNENSE